MHSSILITGVFPPLSFDGHGGDDIDTDPVKSLTVDQCTARCDTDTKCSCVAYATYTHGASSGSKCWKRANCEPANFDTSGGSKYAVYKKAKGYSTWAGRNCFTGHGGDQIDTDKTAPTGLTAAQCQARCDGDDKVCEREVVYEGGAHVSEPVGSVCLVVPPSPPSILLPLPPWYALRPHCPPRLPPNSLFPAPPLSALRVSLCGHCPPLPPSPPV